MTYVILTALVNSTAIGLALIVFVSPILGITSRNVWNATTREAVWWTVLGVITALPLAYMRSDFKWGSLVVPSTSPIVNSAEDRTQRIEHSGTSTVRDKPYPLDLSHSPFPLQIHMNRWPLWILLAWMTACLVMLGRLIVSHLRLSRRKARALDAPEEFSLRVQQWTNAFGARKRQIRVALSQEISGPVLLGPFRPTILIPTGLYEALEQS